MANTAVSANRLELLQIADAVAREPQRRAVAREQLLRPGCIQLIQHDLWRAAWARPRSSPSSSGCPMVFTPSPIRLS